MLWECRWWGNPKPPKPWFSRSHSLSRGALPRWTLAFVGVLVRWRLRRYCLRLSALYRFHGSRLLFSLLLQRHRRRCHVLCLRRLLIQAQLRVRPGCILDHFQLAVSGLARGNLLAAELANPIVPR